MGTFPFGQIDSVCAQWDANVPLPRNAQEDRDFDSLFKSFGLEFAILGTTDLKKEGEWRDLDGKLIRYTNWYPSEPSNSGLYTQGGENYAQWRAFANGKWNDDGPAAELENYVCEKLPG